MAMPFENMLATMTCIMSACDNSQFPTLLNSLEVQQNLTASCGVQYTRLVNNLQQEMQQQFDQSINKLRNIEQRLKTVKDLAEAKASKYRVRRHISNGSAESAIWPQHCSGLSSGQQTVSPTGSNASPFDVLCERNRYGRGWMVVADLAAADHWPLRPELPEHRAGFGRFDGEFFIGFDKLHAITDSQLQELLILLADQDGIEHFAYYRAFAIGTEELGYKLNLLGRYDGNIADPLRSSVGRPFTLENLRKANPGRLRLLLKQSDLYD